MFHKEVAEEVKTHTTCSRTFFLTRAIFMR